MIIRQQLVTSTARTYGTGNRRRTVTIHNTGNTNEGAGAAAHANLQSAGNVRKASWHWQVDDKEAVQSYDHSVQCWHAGDGRGPGNLDSIAIEICMNPDSDWTTAVTNAALLVSRILLEEGRDILDVVQHNHWSGKNCPGWIRAGVSGIGWGDFLDMVLGGTPSPEPSPVTPPTPATTGDDIMAALPTIDFRSSGTITGSHVGVIQSLLLADGYGPAGLVNHDGFPDGIGGSLTKKYVGQFQVKHGTGSNGKADYLFGPKSWKAGLKI